jgi:hypothetical protein
MTTQDQHATAWTQMLRPQSVAIIAGRPDSEPVELYELICASCGDDLTIAYRDAPLRHQRIRGPYPLDTATAKYDQHVRLHQRT